MGDIDTMSDSDLTSVLYQLGAGHVEGPTKWKRPMLRIVLGSIVKELPR